MREKPLVIKFGGTSVGGGEQFVRAAGIAATEARRRPVAVVVSAMRGVTDELIGYTGGAGSRTAPGVEALLENLARRHLEAARWACSGERLAALEDDLYRLLSELRGLCLGGGADRREAIASFGERLSARMMAAVLDELGVPAAVAQDPIATRGGGDGPEVDPERTRQRCNRSVTPLLEEGMVAVVPGYVGRDPDGGVATLGRGGSDLSATVLGRALGSEEVWIMTDVDGVLSADPTLVPGAVPIPHLSYEQAGAFARLGAKVLHPRTMEPAEAAGMEVVVRNTFNPSFPGTRISSGEGGGARCVGLRRGIAVEIPCGGGRRRRAAAVVCIGGRESGLLERGTRCLLAAGISPLHATFFGPGAIFFVAEEREREALRALHDGLVVNSAVVGEGVA
ncbi:aspartate kinase [Rubrobacter calidifluminis]|uniref:aspartate kinase n=1 Tax=Rubrobacter calidifluminis TaxID=1392640 RepID=UPI002360B9AF|nr:aspartate kinase [Rubrobacter calidifluminis]